MFFDDDIMLEDAPVLEDTAQSVVEATAASYLYTELAKLDDEARKEFVESAEAEALLEKAVLNKKTMVRLSRQDDMARRVKIAAYQLAKDKKDPLWTKLVLNRVKERQFIAKIVQKYHNAAVKLAKVGQREFIKSASKIKALPNKK